MRHKLLLKTVKTVNFYNNLDILLEKNIEAHCTSISCTFNVQCINNNIDVSYVKQIHKHYTVVNVLKKKTPKLPTLNFVDASFELTLKFKHGFCNYLCQLESFFTASSRTFIKKKINVHNSSGFFFF